MGGRINHAEISYKSRQPIFVDPKHHLTGLIIDDAPKISLHVDRTSTEPDSPKVLGHARTSSRQSVRSQKYSVPIVEVQKTQVQKMGNLRVDWKRVSCFKIWSRLLWPDVS